MKRFAAIFDSKDNEQEALKLNLLIKPSYVTFRYVGGHLATRQKMFFRGQSQKFASYFSCTGTL